LSEIGDSWNQMPSRARLRRLDQAAARLIGQPVGRRRWRRARPGINAQDASGRREFKRLPPGPQIEQVMAWSIGNRNPCLQNLLELSGIA